MNRIIGRDINNENLYGISIFRTVLYFLLFFILLYSEPILIGSITLSQLWKIPLMLYLLFYVFLIRRRVNLPKFVKFSYARAVKNLITGGILINPLPDLLTFLRYMLFPLMYEYLSIKIKRINELNKILITLAQFVILSGIPFFLGLLESQGREISMGGDLKSFVGVFQNPHAASATIAMSLLVLMVHIKNNKLRVPYQIYNILIIGFGIFSCYFTFVRTGYVMLIIGILVLFSPKRIRMKQIFLWAVILAFLMIGIIFLLENNEIFYNRIFDIRNGSETALGSGRLQFWRGSYELWLSGDSFRILFGFGMEALKERLFQITGLRIFAHNEFFTELAVNGIFGVIFFILFMGSLYRFIRKRKESPTYKLAFSVFFVYLTLMMTQGGMIFPVEVFMALILVKLEKEHNGISSNASTYFKTQSSGMPNKIES